jgi:putative spermidine/putrescine transport system substrate-binding protein
MREKRSTGLSRRELLARAGALGGGIALSGFAVACGDSTSTEAASSTAAADAGSLKGTGEVVVYDGGGQWGAAQRAAYFEPFEALTGIKVIPNPGTEDSAPVLASVKAGSPQYDVYDVGGSYLQRFVDAGAVSPLDFSYWKAEDKAAIGPAPVTKYGVPSLYYSMVLAWDPDQVSGAGPSSWADFWDVGKFPGKRSLAPGAWGASSAVFEAALLADGVAPDALYPLDLDRAFRSLDRIKPHILKYWAGGAEPPELINGGQVALSSAFNGRVDTAIDQGAHLTSTWAQGILEYEYVVVLKGAKNTENAMKYIAFCSQAKPQAEFAKRITYSPTNTRAFEFIDAERQKKLPTAPANKAKQVVQDYAWWNSKAAGSKKSNEEVAIARWEEWLSA